MNNISIKRQNIHKCTIRLIKFLLLLTVVLITVTLSRNSFAGDSVNENPGKCLGQVKLDVLDTNAHPGDKEVLVTVSLTNPDHSVSSIETLLVDEDNNLTCTGCAPDPVRAPGFMCYAHEQDEGGCKVVMIDVDASELIEIGNGAVFTVDYVVSTADYVVSCVGTPDQCINVAPTDSIIADDLGKSLSVREESGEICFIVCGDVYPGGDDCGDGVVNIFDILEEIDISLDVVDKPSDCQLERGNVPTSLPPDCVVPDDEINVFDVLVIIDKALLKPNCCDYDR